MHMMPTRQYIGRAWNFPRYLHILCYSVAQNMKITWEIAGVTVNVVSPPDNSVMDERNLPASQCTQMQYCSRCSKVQYNGGKKLPV